MSNLKETPRNISQTARRSAKYRNPNGPSKYFAPFSKRKLVDENIDDVDLKQFELQDGLCPLIWNGDELKNGVRRGLIKISNQFIKFLGVDLKVKDVIITGSMANYNWNEQSDIDVHILIDPKDIDADEEVVSELFFAKKTIWNTKYNIKVKGHDVEMYVQDVNAKPFANGIFSLAKNKWIKHPEKVKGQLDLNSAKMKAASIMGVIDNLNDVSDPARVVKRIEKIKNRVMRMRNLGLSSDSGEMSAENIAFKILRNSGYMQKLVKLGEKAYNNYFSLNEDLSVQSMVLKEEDSPKYEYGCLMAYFRPSMWEHLLKLIDPNDLYDEPGYGLEKEPHVTILFGFHDDKVDPKELKKDSLNVLGDELLQFNLGKASLFDNPDYDVLKFDIEDTQGLLRRLNAFMVMNYEHTNKYPDYHPHATIAYVKKGLGQKYTDLINEQGLDLEITPDRLVYSGPEKSAKFYWTLNKGENVLEIGEGLEGMTPKKLDVIKDFISFTQQKLGIKARVFVSLRAGRDEYIRTTAAYGPAEDKNYIRCNGRALVDILRSIGHEMVHNRQRELGQIDMENPPANIGGRIEDLANSVAGVLIKDFTHNHGYDHIYDL